MSDDLDSLRTELDHVDSRLVEALAERRNLIERTAAVKARAPVAIRDSVREEEILARRTAEGSARGVEAGLVDRVFREILDASVRYQSFRVVADQNGVAPGERLAVGYQGAPGSYSHTAAVGHFEVRDVPVDLQGFDSFREMLSAVERGDVELGFLPIENTTAGSINEAYDELASGSLSVVGEEVLKVEHCLIALRPVPVSSIRRVLSHPQALAQCQAYLGRLDDCRLESFLDTAMAVEAVRASGDETQAAIASESAARLHGLVVIDRNLADQPRNYTRFVVVSRRPVVVDPRIPSKTSLVFTTPHVHGALARCLSILAEHGLNLTKLESRPVRHAPFTYRFYADVEGNLADEVTRAALQSLGEATAELRVLGTYPSRRAGRDSVQSSPRVATLDARLRE